ncbi:MAG: cysteine-rich CWC family protein [Fibrobacteres bacterium]|nr:cysteine-rich CWC family protein [Fibrobacterota bacterium]
MEKPIDDKKCPICGRSNGCRAGDPDCWCNGESVPQGLRDLVPAPMVMKACICRACVLAYKADPAGFVAGR